MKEDAIRGQDDAQLIRLPGQSRARASVRDLEERRRLERDLHDGVQSELVSLIARLKLAEEDFATPPALAETFVALSDHAIAALASVRDVANGIYPPSLARSGVVEALRARAQRASAEVRVSGDVPRTTEEAEAAVYFSCSEAIQNVAKHAGRAARAELSLSHHAGTLAVRVKDDGHGFDPERVIQGAGLTNIRDRIAAMGGFVHLTSSPGRGTVLTISLPWPSRASRTEPRGMDQDGRAVRRHWVLRR
jgi:signal transduction histidine kinase